MSLARSDLWRRRARACALGAFALAARMPAQATLRIVGPDPDVVRLGDRARLALHLDGALAASAELGTLPTVDGIKLRAGPRRGGPADGGVSWPITLRPERVGSFDIPADAWTVVLASGDVVRAARIVRVEAIAVGSAAGAEHAFVELRLDRDRVWVGQMFESKVRFGIERAYFRDHAVSMFPRRLDAPVDLRARWLDGVEGARVEPLAVPAEQQASVAINGGLAQVGRVAQDQRGERLFDVFEIRHAWVVDTARVLELPPTLLRFATASGFREDFVRGRVPVGRQDTILYADPVRVTVEALPDDGRPDDFSGAVGRFEIDARALQTGVAVGDVVTVEVTVRGSGSLDGCAAPMPVSTDGVHLYGSLEQSAASADARRWIVDLALTRDEIRRVPAFTFSYFDPDAEPAGFERVTTQPIELRIIAGAAGGAVASLRDGGPRLEPGVSTIFGVRRTSSPDGRALSVLEFSAVAAAPWCVGLLAWWWQRRRRRRLQDPDGLRAERAARRFHAALRAPGADPTLAFVDFVAARARCPVGAVVAPGTAARLTAVGVPVDLASRVENALLGRVARRYAGTEVEADSSNEGGVGQLGELVAAVESSLRGRSR